MKVFINCIRKSSTLKDKIIQELSHSNIEWIDLYDETLEDDVFAVTVNTIEAVKNNEDAKALIIDDYGIAPFIIANKHKNIIAASVSDDRSAYMTARHNNTKIMILASEIVGHTLAVNCAKAFGESSYDAGRHQIRIDMLNSLC